MSAKYRFSAWYPPGWQLLIPGSQSLEIINFPQSQRVTGTIIPENGALIQAGPDVVPGSIQEQINASLLHAGAVAPALDQTLVTGLTYPGSPKTLRQVEYYENYGTQTDPVLQHITTFWCEINGRVASVALFYWRGNKGAKMLEGEALDVARSLRVQR
ncbi:MAG: hypothetical protein ACRD1M_10520 [Terriglobales bacterium]